ncbi:MAG: YfhO family protein [Clostridia bacterium]|jgi:uncharacterized membrane protein YfhO|nr:YfhO family protein [Clostridia bacterium]
MKNRKINSILNLDIDNEKVKKIGLYGLSFFIPFFIIMGIISILGIYPFGSKMYIPFDAYEQYTSFFGLFRNLFFGEADIFYSLGKTIGGEIYSIFTYYLLSPFNLIAIFFKKEYMVVCYYFIVFIKMSSAGTSFFWYLNKKTGIKATNLIFGTMYALSSASITYGINMMWLDSLILMPIIAIGIEKITKKESPILYAISLAICLITNYYMGFIVCIFSLIYFTYILLIEEKRDIKKIEFSFKITDETKEMLRKFRVFIIFSLIAVLIASIVLIPSFVGIQEGRANATKMGLRLVPNFEIQDFIGKFFTNSFNIGEMGNTGMPPVFCGVLANFLIILYFINKKISLREKICTSVVFAIFALSFYVEGFNLLWVMGNNPACFKYRYAFFFAFLYIIIAHKSFENLKSGISSKKILITTLIYEMFRSFCIKPTFRNN